MGFPPRGIADRTRDAAYGRLIPVPAQILYLKSETSNRFPEQNVYRTVFRDRLFFDLVGSSRMKELRAPAPDIEQPEEYRAGHCQRLCAIVNRSVTQNVENSARIGDPCRQDSWRRHRNGVTAL